MSAEWSGLLNDNFKKNPNYVYEAILMDYLLYSSDSTSFDTQMADNFAKIGKQIYSKAAAEFGGSWQETLSKYRVDDLKEFYRTKVNIKNMDTALSEAGAFASSARELTDAVCNYLALQEVKESRIELLKAARTACANLNQPNQDFIDAADKMIEIMEGQALPYIQGESMEYLWGTFLNLCWDGITKVYPALEVIDFGKMGSTSCLIPQTVLLTISN